MITKINLSCAELDPAQPQLVFLLPNSKDVSSTGVFCQSLFFLLTNPKSKSKSDLGFSLVTHFPTPTWGK